MVLDVNSEYLYLKVLQTDYFFMIFQTHSLSLRRHVPGRSKEFDVLLAEHKARVAAKNLQQDNSSNASLSPQPSAGSKSSTPVNSPFGFDKIVFPSLNS